MTLAIDSAMAAIAALDLSAVRRKVVAEKGWTRKTADYAELRYRRFLCLHRLEPGLVLVPAPDIDAFWHQHILFTRAYARDCRRLFGRFLHHDLAAGTENAGRDLERHFVATARLYVACFA